MRSKVLAGVVGGLVAGAVFGIMMQMMKAPDGGPVMGMVAAVVRSDNLFVGWIYHLFNSAVIGGIFGLILGGGAKGYGTGLGLGMVYGLAWWIVGGLITMPLLLGMAAFAPLTIPEMRSIGFGSLAGHLVFGMILGLVFVRLRKPRSAGK